ncbi:hypothetical protein ABZ318_29655 [Streptomyces sp. NPDC006197]|uniref:hypothetical protein n=1 Tax=Streptomyces sp. NPDC006197 TaxID=3156685 RepID=UPI0033AAA6C0
MSERNTLLRSMHDVGLAAWFGGALMGAVALNRAAADETTTWAEQARIASSGWAKWTPVAGMAIAAHLVGSSGLLAANAARVATQQGVAASTIAKTVLTGAALATTAYSRVLGKKIEHVAPDDSRDEEKTHRHPADIAAVQRQLDWVQWAVPALTGGLLILNAVHGEQQRPAEQLRGMWQRARSLSPDMLPLSHWHH